MAARPHSRTSASIPFPIPPSNLEKKLPRTIMYPSTFELTDADRRDNRVDKARDLEPLLSKCLRVPEPITSHACLGCGGPGAKV